MYTAELEVALAAALRAGALLRDEFHRPGGPRGHGGHAVIDRIAEEAIHAELAAAFPGYGYVGEELEDRRRDGEHVWVVDPNDGTRAYLRGYRGSSVSIALLRGAAPVLGVVYAPCAPDDDGDLLFWAEGCGPLMRNHRRVERIWPAEPSPDAIALPSQEADRRAAAYAAFVAPMRFRGMPSIAYRLALAAAGDGDVAFSGHGTSLWDYAAGHALLRGAGGEFRKLSGRCFGGAPALVEFLARRTLGMRLSAGPTAGEALVRPTPGRAVRDVPLLRRAQDWLVAYFASGGDPAVAREWLRTGTLPPGFAEEIPALPREVVNRVLTNRSGPEERWTVDALYLAEGLASTLCSSGASI